MEIKMAEEIDLPIVHKLMLEAFEEYRSLDVPSSALNESLESLQTAIKAGTEKALLCSINDIPFGSCRFTTKEDSIYFSRLSVTPHARGKGIAKTMLLWLEQYAKNHFKSKMECRVRKALFHNILLYESIGYIISKEDEIINPDGFLVRTVFMEKPLNSNISD